MNLYNLRRCYLKCKRDKCYSNFDNIIKLHSIIGNIKGSLTWIIKLHYPRGHKKKFHIQNIIISMGSK